jgi:Na+-translocating ferredoxin:NAD+ oxidoreductase subunit G
MNNRILKLGIILFLICLFAAGLLSSANYITKEKIAFQEHLEVQNALKEVMPEADSFKPVKKDKEVVYYDALDNQGNVIGYCFIAEKFGYSSTIRTMVGMEKERNISGIKIINHNETPGLGAKITELTSEITLIQALSGKTGKDEKTKPWFEEYFSNKNIDRLDKVDTITGATISSETVINSIQEKAGQVLELIGYE